MYEKLKNVTSAGGSDSPSESSDKPTSEDAPEWYAIKSVSLAAFVNRCEQLLLGEAYRARKGQPQHNFELRRKLYDMAHSSGRKSIVWHGVTYTGPMILDLYHARDNVHELFKTKAEWLGFWDAMCKLRDPLVPMTNRVELLRIGEAIEARQRPHAERMGWMT